MSVPVLLYVEDEDNDVFFLQYALTEARICVALHTASTGPDAIAYLSGTGAYGDRALHPLPTVVLLDVNLPGCSGFDVLKWLRGRPDLHQLPVIIFSSSARPEDIQKARELGATDYLQKPASGLDFSDVLAGLQQYWMDGE